VYHCRRIVRAQLLHCGHFHESGLLRDRLCFSTPVALPADLLANLDSLGYTEMTAVQAQSLPLILAGKDLIAQARTGSGKTAAFGIGLLQPLESTRYFDCQALVLCPTRELADQVAKEIRRLARAAGNIKILTLCGGVAMGPAGRVAGARRTDHRRHARDAFRSTC
jgi:ATP-dependent RNA helicase DbpA